MPPEFLSITPQRVRCYVCGTFAESPSGWNYRLRLSGHSPVCPSCVTKVRVEIEKITNHPNLVGGVLLGTLAALAGSIGWYDIAVGTNQVHAGPAIGIGCLVGIAVVFGSGNKHGPWLQVAAGALAFAGILGGEYRIVNHLMPELMPEQFSGWSTFKQFLAVTRRLWEQGEGIFDLIFDLIYSAIGVWLAVLWPRADRLVSEPPTGVRRWRQWVS